MQSKTVAMWKPGFESLHKADPQKVADEIARICPEPKPEQIVERARDSTTELHKCFDWNDTTAAEKWRIHQARQIVCHLVFKRPESEREKPPIRIFYKNKGDEGYKPTTFIMQNKSEYDALLEQAYAELHRFKEKYHTLSELEEIMALIA